MIIFEELESQILKGNPLGDPSKRTLAIYLPPAYDADFAEKGSLSKGSRFPVIYCLAGFGASGRSFLNEEAFAPSFVERMDLLFTSGVPEALLVMPDCRTRYGGSQYLNSPATGNYQDYLIKEVVPFVDGRFPTLADRRRRGVMGKSSGGYGALVLAMKFPEVFSACASHSGDLYFEYCYKAEFPKFIRAVEERGGVQQFLQEFFKKPKKTSEEFAAMNILAMAACYSPSVREDPPIAFPFDLQTGEIREEVWRRWLEHDPVCLVDRYHKEMGHLSLLYLDAGKRDEYSLHLGARIFSAKLRRYGVPHEYEEFDDTHRGIGYRYPVSIEKMARILSA